MNLSDPIDATKFHDIMAGLQFHAYLEENFELSNEESAYAMLIHYQIQKLENKLSRMLEGKERILI